MLIVAKPPADLLNGIRWFARRELGDSFSDTVVEDICREVTESIDGDFAEHWAKVLVIARRHIEQCRAGRYFTAAAPVQATEQRVRATEILRSLKKSEREALIMFYCDGMTAESASRRAKMSTDEFAALRRRARGLFAMDQT